MPYDPQKHHRRSIRLRGHDYTGPGVYFITLCTHQRQCLFGHITDGILTLNANGDIVAEEWLRSAEIRKEIELDQWVVMPNHFHAIVQMRGECVGAVGAVGAQGLAPLPPLPPLHSQPNQTSGVALRKSKSLGTLVAGFKASVTKRINGDRQTPGTPIWQRNYYETIVRDEDSLATIRRYIHSNPLAWEIDQLHPHHSSKS